MWEEQAEQLEQASARALEKEALLETVFARTEAAASEAANSAAAFLEKERTDAEERCVALKDEVKALQEAAASASAFAAASATDGDELVAIRERCAAAEAARDVAVAEAIISQCRSKR